jgi:hypothetical protein
MSSLAVPRTLFPYIHGKFHPKLLKFLGQTLPWRSLNHLIKVVDSINASARGIYDTQKRLLKSTDDSPVKKIGDGKDIISLLSASIYLPFSPVGVLSNTAEVQANATTSVEDRLSEEEILAQMTYALIDSGDAQT